MGFHRFSPEKRAELIKKGFCTKCGSRPALPNRKRCQGCRDHDSVWQAAHQEYYRKAQQEYRATHATQIQEAKRRRKEIDPGYAARKSREWLQRLKEDPERYQQYLEREREKGCKRRRAKGMGPRPPLLSEEEKRERQNVRARHYMVRLQGEVIAAYGGKCTCCGEMEPKFLCLDHIDRQRPEEGKVPFRKGKNRPSTATLWRWLKREGWPQEGYQLLCWNCNQSTRWGGPCPHQGT